MRILVLCAANPATNPRPSRLINFLKKNHSITAMGINASIISGVEVISYSAYKKRNIFQEIWLYFNVFLKRWDRLIFTKNRREISAFLKKREFDFIVCHDLVLLPIVLGDKKGARVLFDAREFYPKQNTTSLRWRILFERFNDYLCKTYLHQVDKITSVSSGIKKLYAQFYGINSEVLYSLSEYSEITPSVMDKNRIKMIYHGSANTARAIEKTIYIIDYLPDEYSLDLMLVFDCSPAYERFLRNLVKKRAAIGKKIRIIPPVPFSDLVSFSANYDIGIYALADSTLNLKYAMPNKFFEYIQSRLALAIFPHAEMEAFLRKYQNGVVAMDKTSKSIAQAILSIDRQRLMQMKIKSHIASKVLNYGQNEKKMQSIMRELFFKIPEEKEEVEYI